jgi:hypothetical protein
MYTPTKRERRVGLHLKVEVAGRDALSKPFQETTRSLNISGGGICFETNVHLDVGGRLELTIELPPPLRRFFGDRPIYKARALICRVEHFEAEPRFRIGARFLGEIGV